MLHTINRRSAFAFIVLGGLISTISILFSFPSVASAAQLQRCAGENGICRLPYPAEVIYGAQDETTSKFVDRESIRCSNDVFGDPAPGLRKSCFIVLRERRGYDDRYGPRPSRWRPCANEGESCDFDGRKRVRYGAQGQFTEDVFEDGVDCDNETFGDPAPGIPKRCYIRD